MNNRLDWIDQYRGLAMIFVVLSHTCTSYDWLYTYTMLPMFFFISGYLHKPKKDFVTFANRIVKRLLVPMIIFGTLPFLFQYIKTQNSYLLVEYLIGVLTGTGIGWFLPCLIVVEVIVFIVDFFTIGKQCYTPVAAMIICISFASLFVVREYSNFAWAADTAIISIGFYYFGSLFKIYRLEDKIKISRFVGALILICYLVLSLFLVRNGFYFNISVNRVSNPFVVYPMCILACLIFLICVKLFNTGKTVSWIGRNSLFIYCTNIYVHPVATFILRIIGVDNCDSDLFWGGYKLRFAIPYNVAICSRY